MEPIALNIQRPSQSSQSYHNNVNQWNSWTQQRVSSHYGQQTQGKDFPYNATKTFNKKMLNCDRNTIKTEINALNTDHCGHKKGKYINTNARTAYNSQKSESLLIEWDCIDSFHEFAIYMDKSNPICPAELLDTPEKLMNLLVF